MRTFAAVPPVIWQTDVKKLRGDATAIAVHYHLTTSPHSNMIGLYPLDVQYLAIDLGIPFEGASKGLRRVIEGGLATYDEASEIVWVHDMAISQVAPRLSPKDNRVSAVAKLLSTLPICPITLSFYQRYGEAFHLRDQLCLDEFEMALGRGLGGAWEPLRSKEKEKDKYQEQDLGSGQEKSGSGEERYGAAFSNEGEAEQRFPRQTSVDAARRFLIEQGVPRQRLEDAIHRLMRGALFPCDIADWKREARNERAA